MTVQNVHKDPEARTMTITAEFDAPLDRVWQLWADPRLLERWWGPPTYPATFEEHDLTPGGRVTYYMTGPDGDRPRGWWRVLAVEAPHRLEFEDGFADDSGQPVDDLPVSTVRVTLSEPAAGRTRMELASAFASLEDMERILAMGAEEGLTEALGQIDALLAEAA
jgi:uncharacterized protein YndB with AHSA1/START domain